MGIAGKAKTATKDTPTLPMAKPSNDAGIHQGWQGRQRVTSLDYLTHDERRMVEKAKRLLAQSVTDYASAKVGRKQEMLRWADRIDAYLETLDARLSAQRDWLDQNRGSAMHDERKRRHMVETAGRHAMLWECVMNLREVGRGTAAEG